MAKPIEFYFDFSSPYGYVASHRVDAIAARHGREVAWKPFMLGAVFKIAGTLPLVNYPLKGDYSKHDFMRSARLHGVPFRFPSRFPLGTVAAARGHYWLAETSPELAVKFDRAVYAAYFAEDGDISDAGILADLATGLGVDRAAFLDAIEQPAIKAKVKEVTDDAIARGVFGSPFIFIDGEPFWGNDRLDMVDRWLATGGW